MSRAPSIPRDWEDVRTRLSLTLVPTRQLPNWMVRLATLCDPAIKLLLPELGKLKNATNEKARRVLGWTSRANEEAIVATAESLVRLGLLKDSPKKAA